MYDKLEPASSPGMLAEERPRERRQIVLCCDGTGNRFSKNNTNVVLTFSHLERDERQAPFYDPGVGTFSTIPLPFKGAQNVGTLLGKAFGIGVADNVADAYEFLMNHYRDGDEVYVFGFSRGAYTARLLTGVIARVGLLRKDNKNLISEAIRMALKHRDDVALQDDFKRMFARDCRINFLGVWDTVSSLWNWSPLTVFKDNFLASSVVHARHAIAIDEQRKKFPVTLWNESQIAPRQTIKQVWFAGVHSDVGGWYEERGLSDIALEWMLKEAKEQGLYLSEDWQGALNGDALGPLHQSRKGFWKVWRRHNRRIPEGALIHQSVKTRMDAQDYEPDLPARYTFVE